MVILFEKSNGHWPGLVAVVEDTAREIGTRPYTGKEVVRRLGITNQERLRWTRNRRLVRQGNNIIHRGQKIALVTYSTAAIDDLCEARDTIERWRQKDAIR